MRFLLNVSIPTGKFDQAIADGTISSKMGKILEETKPEAAYFCAKDGKRGGFLVVNMDDVSEIPKLAEPWFMQFDAEVQFLPTMTPVDLQKANLEGLGKKWK
jgi:Domain of unknown function (DUF3303)